ncbi:Uncharacterised protein [Vibrio cholerae]|nr:Uncharacterised protein [Vibrio cholerae]
MSFSLGGSHQECRRRLKSSFHMLRQIPHFSLKP